MKLPDSNVAKLGAYTVALVVAFGAAFVLGGAVGPVAADADSEHRSGGHDEPGMTGENGMDENGMDERGMDEHGMGENGMDENGMDGHGMEEGSAAAAPPGLAVSGYTLVPSASTLVAGAATDFSFTVTDPAGEPLMAYEQTHEKDLHLIAVRRDLAGFQHVHPVLARDGTWTVSLDLPVGGTYRVFADFAPEGLGRTLVLGTDLAVAGEFAPVALPAPATTSTLDGYEVTLSGDVTAGTESELAFTVTRDGQEVTDLEPYLGAFGHLVSLRVGDLAYLHTHPAEEAGAGDEGGPAVEFGTEFPTSGSYRLFLDFQHEGAVHTAEFTVIVSG